MTAQFKLVSTKKWGYNPADVDPLIAAARTQFANPDQPGLGASDLRTAQFGLIKGGYRISAVDAALDRLDDAFAANEAKRLLARGGHIGANEELEKLRETLLARTNRKKRKRFARIGLFGKGYSVRQVDSLVAGVQALLEGRTRTEIAALREYSFGSTWNGYTEAQVDAFIDRAIEYLQLSAALA